MHYDKEKPINCVFFACDTLMTKFEDVMTLPPANKLFEETKEKRYEKPIHTTWEHLN